MKAFSYAAAALLSSPLIASACDISDLEGKFKLEYDFYRGSDNDYAFPADAAMTFSKPASDGSGVMNANYCFLGTNSNQMVAVPIGIAKGGVLPIKIVKYEDEVKTQKIYNEYSFTGEYDCNAKTLFLGFTSYFEANAYSLKMPAEKDDDLDLNASGCTE